MYYVFPRASQVLSNLKGAVDSGEVELNVGSRRQESRRALWMESRRPSSVDVNEGRSREDSGGVLEYVAMRNQRGGYLYL